MKRFLFLIIVGFYYGFVSGLAGVSPFNNPWLYIAINWPTIALACFVASDWDR